MTPAELAQIEAAKVALGKATPGPWEIQLFDTVAVDFLRGRALVNAPEDEVFYDAVVIAAAPVLVERVIELEAELQRLKEWQEKAMPHIQRRYDEDESQVQTIEFELPEWEKSPGYRAVVRGCRERIPELSWLIAQAQEGDKA